MCHTKPETVEHIISGCHTLAADQYLNRHKQLAAQLHLDICTHHGIKVEAECWYQHKPEQVMENEKTTILWDSPVITDRHVPCNKPDIVIQEMKKSDRCQIIDVAIPSDYNIQKKATEKMSNYVDLQIKVPETMDKEGRCHTSHHGCKWNSIQEHQEVCWKNTRSPQHLQSAQISNSRNCTYPQEGTVNKARLSNRARHPTPCESKVKGLHLMKTW